MTFTATVHFYRNGHAARSAFNNNTSRSSRNEHLKHSPESLNQQKPMDTSNKRLAKSKQGSLIDVCVLGYIIFQQKLYRERRKNLICGRLACMTKMPSWPKWLGASTTFPWEMIFFQSHRRRIVSHSLKA